MSNTEFTPKLSEIVKIKKKSENSFDLKQGICAQTTIGGDSFAEWTTMPRYQVLQTKIANYMAVPTPNELVSLAIDQDQYCKLSADVFLARRDHSSLETIWLVPYTVEWCVSDIPTYKTKEDCEKGIRPNRP
ncbi:MAG: hypothetical protein IPM97_00805 [Bdellovibrionaceae bacterium]|nr:hypothetical protein [Pseudobdellovibrionaceae bacterium]